MVWWLGSLIVLSAAALGFLGGTVLGRVFSWSWPWSFSRKQRPFVTSSEANTADRIADSYQKSENRTKESPVTNKGQIISDIPAVTIGTPSDILPPIPRSVEEEIHIVGEKSKRQIKARKKIELLPSAEAKSNVKKDQGSSIQQLASSRKANDFVTKPQTESKQPITDETTQVENANALKLVHGGASPVKSQEILAQDRHKHFALILEIQTNHKIATGPWTGKPLEFQTKMWDINSGEFEFLGSEHQQQLAQAYVDMALANYVVWVWNELGSPNKEMEVSYKRLCTQIAERLASIIAKELSSKTGME